MRCQRGSPSASPMAGSSGHPALRSASIQSPPLWKYWVDRLRGDHSCRWDALEIFRTGVDDLPEILAVLDLLYLGGQPTVAADPVLHRVRVEGHQGGWSR